MTHRDPDPRTGRLTVEQYLRREARARVRHEYVAGFVYAMTGATIRHNRIIRNLVTRLNAAAGAGPCEVFDKDVKIRVGDDRFYYPDVVVNCVPVSDDDLRRRRVEVHTRGAAGAWTRAEVAGQGIVAVPCPAAELTLDEIYAGVALPAVGERAAAYAAGSDTR